MSSFTVLIYMPSTVEKIHFYSLLVDGRTSFLSLVVNYTIQGESRVFQTSGSLGILRATGFDTGVQVRTDTAG